MARPAALAALLVPLLASCLGEAPSAPGSKEKQADPTPPAASVRVEVWHDTICPWCRIGLANLRTAVAQAGVPVEVVHHPFLLDPDTPPEGKDLRAYLGGKYGADRVASMFERVSAFGARTGVTFAWDKVTLGPKTDGSHALVDWAPPASKDAVVEALHRAYFLEGRDLGNIEELAAIATSAGLDAAAARAAVTDPVRLADVRARALAASRSGISGVPHFVVGGRALNGARAPEELLAAIRAAR